MNNSLKELAINDFQEQNSTNDLANISSSDLDIDDVFDDVLVNSNANVGKNGKKKEYVFLKHYIRHKKTLRNPTRRSTSSASKTRSSNKNTKSVCFAQEMRYLQICILKHTKQTSLKNN